MSEFTEEEMLRLQLIKARHELNKWWLTRWSLKLIHKFIGKQRKEGGPRPLTTSAPCGKIDKIK